MKSRNVCPLDMRDAFFDALYEIAAKDRSLVVLTADHGAFGLDRIFADFPRQTFNVGISEQNMVNVAAGLALSGKRVFIYTIANFMILRCLEQISVSISGNGLSVNLVSVGGGFTYSSDGPTHHGLSDMNAAAVIPGLAVFNASDAVLTQKFAQDSALLPGANYFRLEKGKLPLLSGEDSIDLSSGLRIVEPGRDLMLMSTGIMVHRALDLSERLKKEGCDAGVTDVFRASPINTSRLAEVARGVKGVVTLEESYLQGGLGSSICAAFQDESTQIPVLRLGIAHRTLIAHGDREWMQQQAGLGEDTLLRRIERWNPSEIMEPVLD